MWSVQTDMWGVYRSRGSLVVERGREGGGGEKERGGIERGGGGGSEIEGE